MWCYGFIIAPKVINDSCFSLSHIFIADLWYFAIATPCVTKTVSQTVFKRSSPLGFKAFKEALRWRVARFGRLAIDFLPILSQSWHLWCCDCDQWLSFKLTFAGILIALLSHTVFLFGDSIASYALSNFIMAPNYMSPFEFEKQYYDHLNSLDVAV